MTQDFIRYGTLGGKYAGIPSHIVSLFRDKNLKQEINKPLILNRFDGEEKWPSALDYLSNYIDFFRQWAYRQADGNTVLLGEIDNYIKDLYNSIEKAKNGSGFDDLEISRLEALKGSLTEKLDDYLSPKLINAGMDGVNELLQNIDNSLHIDSYPCQPESKWLNEDIARISLLLEKIKLTEKLVKKVSPESREKYLLLNRFDDFKNCCIGWIGILERSRDDAKWTVTDENAESYRKEYRTLMSNIKELNEKLNVIVKKNAQQQPAESEMADTKFENYLKGYISTHTGQGDNTQFKDVTESIALEIDKLFLEHKKRFIQYGNNFHKKQTVFEKTIKKTKFIIGKPAEKRLLNLNPQTKLHIGVNAILLQTRKEQLWRSYIWLIIIHDSLLRNNIPIDNSKVKPLKELYWIIQNIITDIAEKHPIFKREGDSKSGMFYIEAALNEVKADLANDKGHNWIISWIFKKTSHIVYVIIAFIVVTVAGAILSEIFTDFGWFRSIKEFIYRILKLN
jgi:hypothetical protein